LAAEVKDNSSIGAFCQTGAYKLCDYDPILGREICDEKGGLSLKDWQVCKLYPWKCDHQSPEFDRCALSWTECLVDPQWDFCSTFSELCEIDIPEYHYKDLDTLGKAICAADKDLFCGGTDKDVKSPKVVCDNIDKLPKEIVKNTGIQWFCDAKTDYICEDKMLKVQVCEPQIEKKEGSSEPGDSSQGGDAANQPPTTQPGSDASQFDPNDQSQFDTTQPAFNNDQYYYYEKLANDPNVKWTLKSDLCHFYPNRCHYDSPSKDRCAANWANCLLDPAWDFCWNFPDLCEAIPQAAYYKYQKPEDMDKDICKTNKDLFCDGNDQGADIFKICENIEKLPQDILFDTSFRSICVADPVKLCYDKRVKDITCPDGKIETNYCELFPSKCDRGNTREYDACAEDIINCMLDPEWHYCDSFPKLCDLEGPPVIRDQWDIDYALCRDESDKYCRGTKSFVMQDVCANIDDIEQVVLDQTSLKSVCSANFTAICNEEPYKSEVCPDNGQLSFDFCLRYPDRCDYNSPTRDKCAGNWRKCLVDKDWKFCDSFDDLCDTAPPPPTFSNYDDIKNMLCSADLKGKLCNGGSEPDWRTGC
jgi:hypothetical protein